MSLPQQTSLLLILSALALLTLGCSKKAEDPDESRRQGELSQLYQLYAIYVKKNEQPPQQTADLATPANEQLSPSGVRALRSEAYVVIWGVDTRRKDSGKVLAYEKDAPQQGGMVLLADGKSRTMSADELRSALGGK